MVKILIKATKYSRTPEADEIFDSRGWASIVDQTTIPDKRKLVSKNKYETPLMDLSWEEYDYE